MNMLPKFSQLISRLGEQDCLLTGGESHYNETNSLRELRKELLFSLFHSLFTSLSHVRNPDTKFKSQVILAFTERITGKIYDFLNQHKTLKLGGKIKVPDRKQCPGNEPEQVQNESPGENKIRLGTRAQFSHR